MIRAALLLAVWPGLAMADCGAVLGAARAVPLPGYVLEAAGATAVGGWCEVTDVVLRAQGPYTPSVHIDRLRLRGGMLDWLAGPVAVPAGLEAEVTGLRMVVSVGDPRMDWLLAAQARQAGIDGAVSLQISDGILRVDRLEVDFPGDNAVALSAEMTGVDPARPEAMWDEARLAALDLTVTTHGLFEAWLLMPLGQVLLPSEGDMDAAAATLRMQAVGLVGMLPDSVMDAAGRAALVAFLGELPNPQGRLALGLRAAAGVGADRLAQTDVARALDGVTITADWQHGAAE